MKDKKAFVLYTDLIHTVKKLPKDKAGDLFLTILEYVNDLNPEPDDLLLQVTFEPIKQHLKRDLKKWEQRAERSRLNGAKGGRPKKVENPEKPSGLNENPSEPKKPVKDNVIVSVTDNVIDSDIKENHTQIFDFRENYYNDIVKDGKTMPEIIGKNLKISKNEFDIYFDEFCNTNYLEPLTDIQYKDAKKHFNNWLKIEIKKPKKPNNPECRTEAVLSQSERLKKKLIEEHNLKSE